VVPPVGYWPNIGSNTSGTTATFRVSIQAYIRTLSVLDITVVPMILCRKTLVCKNSVYHRKERMTVE
jgi:hypothetical protein